MLVKDQLNRSIQLEQSPSRIVSLVPSLSELIVDLGLEEQLLACTKFCVHPKHLRRTKTVVGGTKKVKMEKIRALAPDIILCNKEENTKDMIQELESIAPVHISDIYTLDDALELIKMYGAIFGKNEKALKLLDNIVLKRRAFQQSIKGRSRTKVAYFIWKDPWMVAASSTYIDHMIEEAGCANVFKDLARYPQIDLRDERLLEADYLFLSSEPYPFKQAHLSELQSLFPKAKIKIVDGEMFSWYGSRLELTYTYFRQLL